jgi:Ca2+-binding EF-hand superfamily protein
MKALGDNPTETQVRAIVAEVDTDRDGNISFDEFVAVNISNSKRKRINPF